VRLSVAVLLPKVDQEEAQGLLQELVVLKETDVESTGSTEPFLVSVAQKVVVAAAVVVVVMLGRL